MEMETIITTRSRQLVFLGLIGLLLIGNAWAQTQLVSESSSKPLAANDVSSTAAKSADASIPKAHDNDFVIGNGDVLAINVWKQPDLSSKSVPVRSDGKVSVPLIGEVVAAGQTPLKLEQELTSKFQPYLADPEVTVIVEQINSEKFNILGRVQKPGSYPLVNPTTVLDAIALAGGCRDFAKQKSIYILRRNSNGGDTRLPFNYQDVIKGKNTAQNIDLQPRDTIVVP
jgi:polysaccharide export outer membrane protein